MYKACDSHLCPNFLNGGPPAGGPGGAGATSSRTTCFSPGLSSRPAPPSSLLSAAVPSLLALRCLPKVDAKTGVASCKSPAEDIECFVVISGVSESMVLSRSHEYISCSQGIAGVAEM
jgi:hypothetical protein